MTIVPEYPGLMGSRKRPSRFSPFPCVPKTGGAWPSLELSLQREPTVVQRKLWLGNPQLAEVISGLTAYLVGP